MKENIFLVEYLDSHCKPSPPCNLGCTSQCYVRASTGCFANPSPSQLIMIFKPCTWGWVEKKNQVFASSAHRWHVSHPDLVAARRLCQQLWEPTWCNPWPFLPCLRCGGDDGVFCHRTRTESRWWSMERPVCWTSWTRQVRRSTAPWGTSTWGRGRVFSVCLPSITPNPLRTSTSTGTLGFAQRRQKYSPSVLK